VDLWNPRAVISVIEESGYFLVKYFDWMEA
jgi:hypothetical protein